ncbi:hypothetical protein, partial [Belliella aquatica]
HSGVLSTTLLSPFYSWVCKGKNVFLSHKKEVIKILKFFSLTPLFNRFALVWDCKTATFFPIYKTSSTKFFTP